VVPTAVNDWEAKAGGAQESLPPERPGDNASLTAGSTRRASKGSAGTGKKAARPAARRSAVFRGAEMAYKNEP
jgi:hypothetical protein